MRSPLILLLLAFGLLFTACEKKRAIDTTFDMPMTARDALESISEKLGASGYEIDFMDVQTYEIQTLPQEITMDELYRLADVKVAKSRITGAQTSYYLAIDETKDGKARVKIEAVVEGLYQKERRSTKGETSWQPFPSKGIAERDLFQTF